MNIFILVCNECRKGLTYHTSKSKEEVESFICEQCGKKFQIIGSYIPGKEDKLEQMNIEAK